MRLVCSVYDIKQVDEIVKYAPYLLLDSKLINEENVQRIHSCNGVPILKLNFMLHPFCVKDWKIKIKEYIEWDCLFYITDLGMAQIFKEYGAISRVIYDPVTMITNHLDAEEYFSNGFRAVGLSNEMPVADVKEILLHTKIRAFYQIFGYRLMFHSRRRLVSLYGEKIGKNIKLEDLTLKEATRKDCYPLVENADGTYIYRSYMISLLKELAELDIEYAYLEGFHMPFEAYIQVVKIYADYLKNPNISLALEKMSLLNLPIQDGFAYQDTVYVKEEF